MILILRHRTQSVSNPDADHIGGLLDVFDAFEVESVYASGDPKGTLTHGTFFARRARGGVEVGGGSCGQAARLGRRQDRRRGSRNTQPTELRFRALLTDRGTNELALTDP